MEEDIKLLEEMKQNCLTKREYIDPKAERKAIAIENLIKGYRDSENIMENAVKENLELKKYIRELEEQIDKHVYFETTNPKEIEKNYIPKSKIKEKIEELKNENYQISLGSEIAFDSEIFKNNLKIQVLQELMEE